MATVGNERYLRHILLLGDGGLLVLRGIVSREASRCGQPFETFLAARRSLFDYLIEPQRLKLFPEHSPVNKDTNTWDMPLLITVIRKTFWAKLSRVDKSHIYTLKTHRNELQAHSNSMFMAATDYSNSTQLLITALCHLASGLSADTNTQLQDIIKSAESETIDIKSALQHIRELNEFKETFLQELEKSLLQLTSEIQEMHSSVKNLKADVNTMQKDQLERHHELSTGMEELNVVSKKSQEDISELKEQVNVLTKLILGQMNRKEAVAEAKRTAVKELEIILHMQCEDKDKLEKATDVLYDMIKLIQTGHNFSEEKVRELIYQEIRKNGKVTLQLIEDVIALFKDIDEIPDSSLGFAYKGSIRIPLQCFSVDGLLSQKRYMNSIGCLLRLLRISLTLSKLLGFSCAVVRILVPNLLTDVHKEQSKTSESKTIVIPLHCKSDHGLPYARETFGKINKHTEKMSRTLSDIFNAKITLKACIGIDHNQRHDVYKSSTALLLNEMLKTLESFKTDSDPEGKALLLNEMRQKMESFKTDLEPEGMALLLNEMRQKMESFKTDLDPEGKALLLNEMRQKMESFKTDLDREGTALLLNEMRQKMESFKTDLDPEGTALQLYEMWNKMVLIKTDLDPEGTALLLNEMQKKMKSIKTVLDPEDIRAPKLDNIPDSFHLRRSLPRASRPSAASATFRMRGTEGQQENSLQLELLETYSIRDKDVFIPHAYGLEMLPEEGFILIDKSNKKLKKLDKALKTVSFYNHPDSPWDVCYIDEGKVAVSLGWNGILFADVSRIIKMEKVVLLNIFCGGLAFFGNILYIGDTRSSIYTYTSGDTQPRFLYQNAKGIHSTIWRLAVSQSGEKIYMVCFPGIITINADGRQLATLQYDKSGNASDICVIDDGTILVSDLHSNNVIQINSEGTEVLRTFTLQNIRPFTICYDRQESRLIVGGQDTNMHVYKLPAL